MQDLSGMNGGWVLCFGSISPLGDSLLSEELFFADTENWNDPGYHYHSDQEELADYLGYYPNPYDYGWIVEIEDADTRRRPSKSSSRWADSRTRTLR
ncbi:MAG: hypothetical protein Ct9H300mP10_08960 [Methanobacteriota archaeon]|nr:MAG: hypothetical protein Ct9H300mP10_08960 [Euryarchaeota archaeon]